MKIVLQRVRSASVSIHGETVGAIGKGYLLLVGMGPDDNDDNMQWLLQKVLRLRLFASPESTSFLDLDLLQIDGSVLVVSQFTLYGDVRKGTRPSFSAAAPPDQARVLYERFVELCGQALPGRVQTGQFGADMEIALVNDGPVTLILEK